MAKLTDAKVREIVRSASPGKYSDAEGLYLKVTATGSAFWQMKYRNPRENTASFGTYPAVSLAEARTQLRRAKQLIRQGSDPNAVKRAARDISADREKSTFEAVAMDWFRMKQSEWSDSHAQKILGRLRKHIFPYLGRRPIEEISTKEALEVLRRIEASGRLETAHRAAESGALIFIHSQVSGRVHVNPFEHLGKALKRPLQRHMAAFVTEPELAEYLRYTQGYAGRGVVVKSALELLPLLFLRPGELRGGRWSEVNFSAKEWTIPASRMKATKDRKRYGDPHVVPLSTQALRVLRTLHDATGCGELMFPGMRESGRPISDNTLNTALRAMGYCTATQVTAHGFRATARTLAVEVLHFPEAVVEMQLAHSVADQLGRSYNRTTFFEQRRKLMQDWGDYLERLAGRLPEDTSRTEQPSHHKPVGGNGGGKEFAELLESL